MTPLGPLVSLRSPPSPTQVAACESPPLALRSAPGAFSVATPRSERSGARAHAPRGCPCQADRWGGGRTWGASLPRTTPRSAPCSSRENAVPCFLVGRQEAEAGGAVRAAVHTQRLRPGSRCRSSLTWVLPPSPKGPETSLSLTALHSMDPSYRGQLWTFYH